MQNKSSLETSFEILLNKFHIQYVQQFKILTYRFDFYLPKYNTLIETHGDYWHGKNGSKNSIQKKNKENDIIKLTVAKNYGFQVKTFWEEQILFDPESVEEELLSLMD